MDREQKREIYDSIIQSALQCPACSARLTLVTYRAEPISKEHALAVRSLCQDKALGLVSIEELVEHVLTNNLGSPESWTKERKS